METPTVTHEAHPGGPTIRSGNGVTAESATPPPAALPPAVSEGVVPAINQGAGEAEVIAGLLAAQGPAITAPFNMFVDPATLLGLTQNAKGPTKKSLPAIIPGFKADALDSGKSDFSIYISATSQ